MVLDSLKKQFRNLTESDAEDQEERSSFTIKSASENLVVIPEEGDVRDTDVRYSLLAPFADAHITWDDEQEELVYNIEEPKLNDREQKLFNDIKDALEQKIEVSLNELDTTDKVVDYLGSKIKEVTQELGIQLDEQERTKIMYFIYRNFAGLNEIEPLMHDPYIEDIGCSGTGIPVFIVHSKFGSIKTNMVFDDPDNLKNLVVKLAERCGKYVSYAQPLLDGALPDGSRVNASLTKDVTTKGPTFSIRKFQETPYSAVDLIDLGTVNYEIMAYFWMAMEYQKSVLISGGTATGKTTFLNSVVTFIPPAQKIVSIEDTRELQLPHENWIPSVARSGFGARDDDSKDIGMYRLLKESFRQNPDYVVVGEVRGKEASVLFQGMSSGHPSMGTIHASSPGDVVKRLTTPPINLSPALVETLDLIVIMTRARQYGENARRVKGVYEVETITPEGNPRTNEYISWTPVDDTYTFKNESTILSEIKQQFGYTQDELEEELENRRRILTWMHENGYGNFADVARIVSEYYKDKESVLQAVEHEDDVGMDAFVSSGPSGSDKQMSASLETAQQELVDEKAESEAAKELHRKKEAAQEQTTEQEETPPEETDDTQPGRDGTTQEGHAMTDQQETRSPEQDTDAGKNEEAQTKEKDGADLFDDADDMDENPFGG